MPLSLTDGIYDVIVLTGTAWVTRFYALDHESAHEALIMCIAQGVPARVVPFCGRQPEGYWFRRYREADEGGAE